MSITNFIPQMWSGRILRALDRSLVYGQTGIINRDYEGEISEAGDTVRINSIGDPTIKDYTRNADIDTPEELNDAQALLVIDQQKYFNFAVDDVDKAQAKGNAYFSEAMSRAAFRLRDKVDRYVASLMNSAVGTNQSIGSSGVPETMSTAAEAYNYLVDLSVLLDEMDVPAESRWVIISPWFEGVIDKDDRFIRNGNPSAEEVRRNGSIGRVAGFDVLKSNNVPLVSGTGGVGSVYSFIAGTSIATTFAQQILKMEAFRPERRFSDAVKGLHVYGGKVIRPEALVRLVVTRPAAF